MEIGLIGFPQAGKRTLFELLTEGRMTERGRMLLGSAKVPDPRLDFLASLFHPRKVTPAQVDFLLLPSHLPGHTDRQHLNQFLNEARAVDALCHVIRAFETPELPHPLGKPDVARDAREMETELILADLGVAESALERLRAKKRRSPEEETQLRLLERCRETLEEGRRIEKLGFTEEEEKLLRGYGFLTARPLILAVNLSEEQLLSRSYPGKDSLPPGREVVEFSGMVEREIALLPPGERGEYLRAYGLEEPGVARICRAAYRALGLISFLTAGEEEVRAWPLREGATAREAAGKIHSHMARGFIKAEVVSFSDLERAGSMREARERGLLRLEGRDYVVRDGDVITFRFQTPSPRA